MLLPDVNVLVYAHRVDATRHVDYADWLARSRRGNEPLGLCSLVTTGFVRVVTNERVFRDPTPLAAAVGFIDALRASPACEAVEPGPRHWQLFRELAQLVGVRGNDVTDASLAALAIEAGATLVSADRGFRRFKGLTWRERG